MGEVYRAQDVELGRQVALKFLSGEVAAHQNRLNRFIQEAKAASALNHPNILTVYEIGRDGDNTFIATEFVEGLTLRQKIRLKLRLLESIDIAIQIASALVAAHAAGIVHRDIKPENIIVRGDGLVKVLDFGLAKLTEKQDSSSSPEATTIALVNTEPGAVLGTVAYMSPEQAHGLDVDARSDIWSLGIVLFEMLTSRVPFHGPSKSHTIVAITDQEAPRVTQLAPDVPEPLEWIIGEALAKDRDERCQTAKEMFGKLKRVKQRIESGSTKMSLSDFDNLSASQPSFAGSATASQAQLSDHQLTRESHASSTAQTKSVADTQGLTITQSEHLRPQRAKWVYLVAALIALSVLSLIGFAFYKSLNPPKELGPAKLSALTTGGKINGEDINGQLSISPDGKYVVCAANDAKQQASLWLRQISTNSLVRIVPPENGAYLNTTFSPDGEQIFYVAQLEKNEFIPTLYRVPILGGNPTKVLDHVSSAVGFSKDGNQFAFVRKNDNESELVVVNTDGSGSPKTIAARKHPDDFSASGPSWSPDGKRITCGLINGPTATVVEVPVAGGDPKPIGTEKWGSVGRVLWLADGSGLIMTAQPESSSIGTQVWFVPYPSGPAQRITNDLNAYGEVSLGLTADSKTLATIQQINSSSISVIGPNQDESQSKQIVKTSLPEIVSWSPDGKLVYASRTGEYWDIWITNPDGSENRQLTADAFIDREPSVSADGRYIFFQSNRAGNRNIWRMDIDGTDAKQLTQGNFVDSNPVGSADGASVFFTSERTGKSTIWKVGVDGGRPVQVTDQIAHAFTISPDGKSLAYFSENQASPQLSIISFAGESTKTLVLPRSVQPFAFAWTPDGKSIAYLDNSAGILNVWSQSLAGETPKQLTNFKSEFINSFAIARDGKIAAFRLSATRDIVLIKDFR